MIADPPTPTSAGYLPTAGPAGRRWRRLRWSVGGLIAALLIAGSVTAGMRDGSPWYAQDCLAVGAHVDGSDSTEGLLAAAESLGPLTVHRTFDARLPPSFGASAASADPAAGLHSFVSWKPPNGDYAGTARGAYDDQVAAWARSAPSEGVYGTAVHEPENDMTPEMFVAMHRHLYEVVKKANPGIRWGPVYMAYWWDPAKPDHYVGDPQAWWPGAEYADFAGLDWYGADPRPMTTSANFEHWYATMLPTGVPLFITEYGQYAVREGQAPDPALLRQRIEAIRADATWIAEHPHIRMWLYWQDDGRRGDWRLSDPASQQAWRAVAATGCTR